MQSWVEPLQGARRHRLARTRASARGLPTIRLPSRRLAARPASLFGRLMPIGRAATTYIAVPFDAGRHGREVDGVARVNHDRHLVALGLAAAASRFGRRMEGPWDATMREARGMDRHHPGWMLSRLKKLPL